MRVGNRVWLVMYSVVVLDGMSSASLGVPAATKETFSQVHLRGVMLYREGDYASAAEQFRAEHAVRPDNLRTLAFLGLCYDQLGQSDLARRCWAQLAAEAGSSRLGVLAAARLKERNGRPAPVTESQPAEILLAEVTPQRTEARSEHFVVEAYNHRLASIVAKRAEIHLESIRVQVLGAGLYPHTVRIRIFPTLADYRRVVGAPRWSGGGFRVEPVADGGLRREVDLIQLGPDGKLNERLLDHELPHELSHVVVAEFFGQRACPIWLDEALAMMAEDSRDPARAEIVRLAVRFGTYTPFANFLDRTDWPGDYPMSLLYAQAESVGRFLWSRLGETAGRDLLAQLRLGESVSAALQRALGNQSGPVAERLENRWTQAVIAEDVAP